MHLRESLVIAYRRSCFASLAYTQTTGGTVDELSNVVETDDPSANDNFTDTVEVVTWDYSIANLGKYSKEDRTQTSTLTNVNVGGLLGAQVGGISSQSIVVEDKLDRFTKRSTRHPTEDLTVCLRT